LADHTSLSNLRLALNSDTYFSLKLACPPNSDAPE
jgi:hypothetical protein